MTTTSATFAKPTKPAPPLEQGDHLTRAEFERRYENMPNLKKAELIEGLVYLPSPVGFDRHAGPHADTIGWLGVYRAATPGVEVGDNTSIRLDPDNMPQPDAALIIVAPKWARVRKSPDDYIEGSPDLLAEIASSSVSVDLNQKFRVYRRNEVQEYIVWRVLDQEIDWFRLREGDYQKLIADENGIYRSEVFPGLWLDAPAMVRRDLARVLAVLQEGLQSVEHAEFVRRLQS
ncbi:MAG: Uma2 family endonuclease [Gemmataceae bacterium]|nr:Uma2 family endonuclease [Gemmataceae bacterium]MCI0743716.1 Uma2 family endonuclease [Gemmataceae bacterium]